MERNLKTELLWCQSSTPWIAYNTERTMYLYNGVSALIKWINSASLTVGQRAVCADMIQQQVYSIIIRYSC